MSSGWKLDVESTNDQAKAQPAHEQVDALARHPKTLLKVEATSELQLGSTEQKNPFVQAAWMFILIGKLVTR